MAIIEYDKSPNITPEQRLKSLADSVRRAFEDVSTTVQVVSEGGTEIIDGGTIDYEEYESVDILNPITTNENGSGIAFFGDAVKEGFVVKNGKPSVFTGDVTLNSINSDGTLVANTPIKIINTTDASGTAQRNVPLYIGADNGEHIEIDTNEIMAKATDTTTGHLYINSNGGNVHVCKDGNGDFYINNAKVTDWIVGYGTDGIWTYRKWNSGLAECWGTTPSVATGTLTKSGSIYYKADLKVATVPTGLFTEVEFVMGTQVSANTVGWLCQARHSSGGIYVTYDREQSSATSIVVAVEVKGRWK